MIDFLNFSKDEDMLWLIMILLFTGFITPLITRKELGSLSIDYGLGGFKKDRVTFDL